MRYRPADRPSCLTCVAYLAFCVLMSTGSFLMARDGLAIAWIFLIPSATGAIIFSWTLFDLTSRRDLEEEDASGPTWSIMKGHDKIGELRHGAFSNNSEFWVEYDLIIENAAFKNIGSSADSRYDLGLVL